MILTLLGWAPTPALAEHIAPIQVEFSTSTADLLITAYAAKWDVDPELPKRIIWCESKNDKNAIGENTRNGVVWSRDHGLWQINDYYHQAHALKQGYDITDWRGNLDYGFMLYKEQGESPWLASRACWQDRPTVPEEAETSH